MVGSRYRWHFSNTFYNIFGQTSHLDHLCTFLEFFSGISHMPTFSHSSWWLTALQTAKTTRRRRPAKTLKSYHFGWIFFPTGMWYTVVVSVVTILFNWKHVWQCTCELVVDNTVDGKDNMEEKTSEVADFRRYHFSWNYLQPGSDMQWWYCLIPCLAFFRSFLLLFDHTVDGKDN